MRLLLDTHVALWAIADSPLLSAKARRLILDAKNDIYVSAASVWEIAIKHSLGREKMPISGNEAIDYFIEAGFDLLPVSAEHAARTETLPIHHADPFDRLLLAQALHEPMHLVTHDATLGKYDVTVLLV